MSRSMPARASAFVARMSGSAGRTVPYLAALVAIPVAVALVPGCGARPEPAPGDGAIARPEDGKKETATAEPKLASIRNLGVTRAPVEDPAKGLSQNARKFYDELSRIAKAGKVEHAVGGGPQEQRARGRAMMQMRKSLARPSAPPPRAPARVSAGPRPAGVRYKGSPARGASMARRPLAEAKVGVTTGGMQDIGQARKIIEAGRVPSPDMFAAEGLLSEHDIPLEGMPSGESDLYASASVAWARRYGEKSPVAVVQLGFGVDMDLEAFHRPSLNLAVVVDVSGSMRGGKIEAVRTALGKLLGQLNDSDRLAVVLFNNSAWVPLTSQVLDPDGIAKAKDIVSKIRAGGGTSIESGLRFGYEQVAAHLNEKIGGKTRSPRVMLLTDARPNVGVTTAHGFLPMMEGASAGGIGLTAFGVGLDFGQELAHKIFQVRGANYFYLEDNKKISKCFDEEFEYMVTPAAYDVLVMMVPAEGAQVGDVLGVPDYKKGAEGVELKIPSLFFSKRQGGGASMVALRLRRPDFAKEVETATIDLSFLPVGASEKVRQKIEVFLPAGLDAGGGTPYYSQPGAEKALLLANAVGALKAACRGQRAPRPMEALWTIGETVGPEVAPRPTPRRRGRPGDLEITLSEDEAKRAAEGLGAFADWFASQAGGFDGLEPELRLIEKLESTLRARGGLPALPAPREIPEEAAPDTSPPEMDVF